MYSILEERFANIEPKLNFDLQASESEPEVNMTGQYSLKAINGGVESITKQIIDSIKMYDSFLDTVGKKLIT